tara:strand:- start:214 stop:447 length:234 start_codon:yes stop_codon:yes gene_type:complete
MTTNETAISQVNELITSKYKGSKVSLNASSTHYIVETNTAKKANAISLDMARVGIKKSSSNEPNPYSENYVMTFKIN